MKRLKVLEAFGGIGAPRQALNNLGIEADYTYIDYDKKPVRAYNTLYGENNEPIDITKWHAKEKYDMVIAGFPCQPFSMAGKGLGFDDPRGKLYKDTLRVIKEADPDYVILENVKAITYKNHKWIIEEIEETLKEWGYKVHTQIINAKHYVPQNRERVFIMASKVSQPEEIEMPERTSLLGAYLEKYVEESFYYGPDKLEKILKWKAQEKPMSKVAHFDTKQVKTITTRTQPGTSSQQIVIENNINEVIKIMKNFVYLKNKGKQNGAYNRYWKDSADHLGTITTSGPQNIIENYLNFEKWLLENRVNIKELFSTFNQENYITGTNIGERERERTNSTIGTITASGANSRQKVIEKLFPLRIRSLTPRETWRLMGFSDKEFDKVQHLPKTHLYFTAGNSMVVPVMEAIFKELLKGGDKNE